MRPRRRRSELSRAFSEWTPLAAVVVLSALLRAWAGSKVGGPWFIPDEVIYAELGRSLYRLGHFQILGATPSFFGIVYPLFVGLPLDAAGAVRGYALAKGLQALVMSLTAVPVYLWGRSLVSRGWALVAAVLTLVVPALGLSGFLMTEVVFYPAFCLAAWAIARSLARPTLACQGLALATILLAAMTRLQAVVLAPAFLLAVVVDAGLARSGLRGLRRFAPAFGAFALGALGWVGLAAASGRHALGAYAVTTDARYDVAEALRFVVYHGADLILVTAVVPVVALVAVAVPAFRGRERSPEVRALVATTIALTVVFVPVVGVYASVFTGRIAERNLFFLAPLFFLALVLWLHRGAPRPAVAIFLAAAAALGLLLVTPWSRFVIPAAEPDAFTLVPFVELRERLPGLAPALAVGILAVALLVLLGLPRRLLPLVPLTIGILFAGASVVSSHVAASTATAYEEIMVGSDRRWLDEVAPGPVNYLYGGEEAWTLGGPVWTNLFWNGRIKRSLQLFDAKIAGPAPPRPARVTGDGRVLASAGRKVPGGYVVASARLELAGERLTSSSAGLVLWRVEGPLRIVTQKDGVDPVTQTLGAEARLIVYGCRGGSVALTLLSPDDRLVRFARDGAFYRTLRLFAGRPWSGSVPLRPPVRPSAQACSLSLTGALAVRAERLDYFLPR